MKVIRIEEILELLKKEEIAYKFCGDAEGEIAGYSALNNYKIGTMTWIKNPDKTDAKPLENMQLVVTLENSVVKAKNVITTKNPKEVFFKIIENFYMEKQQPIICKDSIIETEDIGENVAIGHQCYICKDVKIGNNVQIKNGVHIECPCVIGDNTIIWSGVMIGVDGFGFYKNSRGNYCAVPHTGGVTIGKNVEIRANTCVERGTIDDTFIEDNVKIDVLCCIGHNTRVGQNSLVIAHTMLGGSVIIEENSYIAPGSVVMNQVHVGKDAFVGLGAVVVKDVPENKVVVGVPAKVIRDNI